MKNTEKVFAIANQKGGVGKTTTTLNLGCALAAVGKKILAIDFDPQGNLSEGLGVGNIDGVKNTIYELMEQVIEEEVWDKTEYIMPVKENIDLISSNIKLADMELALVNTMSREIILKSIVQGYLADYDYILIDCPPSLGLLTINALAACDSVIIPVQAEYHPAIGVSSLLKTVRKVSRKINPAIKISGILLTMFKERTNLSREIYQMLTEAYGDNIKIFYNKIPYTIKIGDAIKDNKSIFEYSKNNKAAKAYADFAQEFLEGDQYVTKTAISNLKPSPYKAADDMDVKLLEELTKSIKVNIMPEAVEVRELRDGSYEVLSGQSYVNAAILADLEEVPIVIRHNVSDEDARQYAI